MPRLFTTLLLLTLLASTAAAAPDASLPDEATPTLPDLSPIAEGAGAAASAAGEAIAGAGRGLADLASATVEGIGAAFAAMGRGIASLASAIGAAVSAVIHALGGALAALGSLLASLSVSGARYVAAHPKESAIVAASASGAGLLGWAAKKWWLSLFVPLYSRLASSKILDNKVRNAVYDLVKERPGSHPSHIAETLGLGWGTVVYHLARLEEASLVTTREAHNRKCYFAVGSDLDGAGRTAVAAMSTDKARAIVGALRETPGMSQKDLAERLGMSQALASWHVKRLVASGVLVTTRAGRSNLLHVAEHVPHVPAVPVAAAVSSLAA